MTHTHASITLFTIAVATAPIAAAVADWRPSTDHAQRTTWLARYAEARQGPEQTDRQMHVFKVGPGAALDLSNISGDVQVGGDGGSEIRLEATRRVRHRDADEARRLLQELRVDITHAGGRVEVRTVFPRRPRDSGERGISARVDYVVIVPSRAAVAVRTISGDASVTKVTGEVRAEAVSGDVTVTGASNVAQAKSVSGDVTARDIGSAGSLSLGTVSGSVVAIGLKARSLDCGSVSGDVRLSNVQVERLQAKSVSGGIEFGDTLARGGRYDITSHSGDIRIVVGPEIGFELDAGTFSGSVRSDLPITVRPEEGGSRDRRATNRSLRGSYGDASALLSLKTFSGTIVVTRK